MSKGLMIILVFALLALVAAVTLAGSGKPEVTEEQLISGKMSEISEYTNKMMYIDAERIYHDLTEQYPSDKEIAHGYADYCEKYGLRKSAEKAFLSLLESDPEDKETALRLLELYRDSPSDRYRFMEKYERLLSDTELYMEFQTEGLSTIKTMRNSLNYVSDWSRGEYAIARNSDGATGVILSDNKSAVPFSYDEILSYSKDDNLIAVKDHDQYVYTNSEGTRKRVLYNSDEAELLYPDYLGPFSNGFSSLCLDGIWGFCNASMQYGCMDYEKTGTFSDGVVAAKKNGKWGLLKAGFQEILPITNEDICMDQQGYCSENGIVFVKNSLWEMYKINYDEKGNASSVEKCCNLTFEDVKPFGEIGAVKSGGKWGYIKSDGSWLIEPGYDDAKSFRRGVAFVKEGDSWKMISESGEQLSPEKYDDVTSFSKDGCAAVLQYGSWNIIQPEKYYYLVR